MEYFNIINPISTKKLYSFLLSKEFDSVNSITIFISFIDLTRENQTKVIYKYIYTIQNKTVLNKNDMS